MNPYLLFYPFTLEDRIAYSLQSLGKLNSDGIVQESENLKNFDQSILALQAPSIKNLQILFEQIITLNGRCRAIPLEIDVSMHEIAQGIQRAAQEIFNQNSQIIFDGGAIWKIIASTVYPILESWCSDLPSTLSVAELVTPFFKSLLEEMDPNDYDWQFILSSVENKDWNKEIINKGLVDSLAKKFKARLISPHFILLQLAKYKQKVAKAKQPDHSYIRRVFEEHPQINASQDDLHHIFVKAFGFWTAADVEDFKQQICFSLRTVSDGKTSHDCLFPVRSQHTITPINSLFLNVTTLVEESQQQKEVVLESFINNGQGLIPVLQAISDRNLSIFTFDDSKPANRMDFTRTMSLFSLGGRCYQKGWLEKIEIALEQEVKRQQLPLSKVLARQLIDRVNQHHRKQPAALIVLTFNAAAFLLWKNVSYTKEIHKLWQLIFNYIDSIEGEFPHHDSHPLIECIQMVLRDPNFNFEDCYAQIQLSSFIEQHRILSVQRNRLCEPSQTDKILFTQIKLNLANPSQVVDQKTVNFFTLFFPYNLAWAIRHFNQMIDMNPMLQSIHHGLVGKETLVFGFEKSRLREYAADPRWQLPLCMAEIDHLLHKRQEHAWFRGYLLALSLLAQKNDPEFLKKVMGNFFEMLLDQWASPNLKKEALDIFQQTLGNHQLILNQTVLNELVEWKPQFEQGLAHALPQSVCIKLITELMVTHWDPFVDIALEYWDKIDETLDEQARLKLYNSLMKNSLSSGSSSSKKAEQIHLRPLRDLIVRMGKDEIVASEKKLNMLRQLYEIPKVVALSELEDELFEHLLKIMGTIEQPSKKFLEHRLKIATVCLKILQSQTRSKQPFKVLEFFREICRLQIVNEADFLKQFWDQMLSLSPKISKLAYLYQESCLTIVQQFGYWEKFDQSQRESFHTVFTKSIEACFNEFEDSDNARMMIKWDSTFKLDRYQGQIHQFLNKFFRTQLTNWQAHGILTDDKEIVFALIEQLTRSNDESTADLFRQTLVEISKLETTWHHANEIRRMIESFLRSHAKQDANSLIFFLFATAQDVHYQATKSSLAGPIYSFTLELAFILLIHPNKNKKLLNSYYCKFIDYLLRGEKPQVVLENLLNLFKKHSGKFLQELYNRRLCKEVIQIYIAFPQLLRGYALENIKFFVLSCDELIKTREIDQFPIDCLKIILEVIPTTLVDDQQLQIDMKNLYASLFQLSFAQKDYATAQHWLEKEKLYSESLDASFYSRTFELLLEIAVSGSIRKAYSLIMHLKTPKGYASSWLKIFQTLLQHQHISACLFLIRNKKSLMSIYDEQFRETWINLVKGLLDNAYQLSSKEDPISRYQLELQTVLHELIWQCLPTDANIWTGYIDLFTRKAPIKTVEEVLHRIIEQNIFEKHMENTAQIACWKWLLERLAHEGSLSILNIDKWWSKAWKAFENGEAKDKQMLFLYFAQGAAKACRKQKSLLAKKQAAAIVAILEKEEIIDHLRAVGPVVMLSLAKIYMVTEELSHLHSAIYAIIETFILMKSDPINEAHAVQVTNACLKLMINHKDQKSITAMVSLINIIQQSDHCHDADQFHILEYWHAVEKVELANASNLKKSTKNEQELKNSIIQHINDLYLIYKKDALAKIITNPCKNSQRVTEIEKTLVRKTVLQLYKYREYSFFAYFLQDCLKQDNFKIYTDLEFRQKITLVTQVQRMSWIREKIALTHMDLQTLGRAARRYSIQQHFHQEAHFQLLKEENEVLENCKSCLLVVLGVTSIAFTTFNFYAFSNLE